ncbi:hypothetical protein GJ496_004712 [Pomphorhynchus laevis]|nr:hypothetical protein GJ496_004712 [Pomphorhynchus laevis]
MHNDETMPIICGGGSNMIRNAINFVFVNDDKFIWVVGQYLFIYSSESNRLQYERLTDNRITAIETTANFIFDAVFRLLDDQNFLLDKLVSVTADSSKSRTDVGNGLVTWQIKVLKDKEK